MQTVKFGIVFTPRTYFVNLCAWHHILNCQALCVERFASVCRAFCNKLAVTEAGIALRIVVMPAAKCLCPACGILFVGSVRVLVKLVDLSISHGKMHLLKLD